ncbi:MULTISPECIES: hypothetical protein [Xanthomonas]|uniref:hypothetical protein n=2 Tax=Xanthomonas TaxID=338 RepID=UPI0011AFD8E5|nr:MULTISPECIES: hypothetical protein [Xanthomonas]MEA9566460.1 hypothetical protein [Xanthomonas sp. WHRI 8932A]WHO92830.1 hypothetical protein QMY62_00490 [Xanthomonas campestris]
MKRTRFRTESGQNSFGPTQVRFSRFEKKGLLHFQCEGPLDEDIKLYDFSGWAGLSQIAEDLIDATLAILASERATTRNGTHRSLRYGIIQYLNETSPNAELRSLNRATFQDFTQWLSRGRDGKKSVWGYSDRMHKLSALRKMIARLSPKLSKLGVQHDVPINPWPGDNPRRNEGNDKEAISQDHFLGLMRAAIKAHEQILRELDVSLTQIDHNISLIKINSGLQNTLEGLCAQAIVKYGGILPERKWLKQHEPDFFNRVEEVGYLRVAKLISPSINDLLPAFIILQCFTHWNEQPLCCLRISNIDRCSGLFSNKYKLSSIKIRGKGMVHRSFFKGDELFNPCNVIDFVERWTKHLRAHAPQRIRDDLFLYACKFKTRKIGAIRSLGQPLRGTYNLSAERKSRFFKERGLRAAGSSAIRLAGAEYLNEILGDTEKVRVLLGHSTVSVTHNNYRSKVTRRNDEEALAGAMALQFRYHDSNAKVDSRSHFGDRSAASPGYQCLDPFQSPMPGQINGRMCTGYGLCPACPLAVEMNDDVSIGRRIQIFERYGEALRTLGTQRFRERYGNAYDRLGSVLASTLKKSNVKRLEQLVLNPIPPLE